MRVRIYSGHGTSQLSVGFTLQRFAEFGITAQPILPEDIKQSHDWMDETDLLVFTSNSASKFMEALEQRGMDAIQHFIRERGGLYLGICAGAYFGAEIIDFSGEHLTKRTNGLGFFNIVARGGLNDIMGRPYSGFSDSAAIVDMIDHETHQKFSSLYWGGPRFLLPEKQPHIEPLFWMLSADKKEPYLMGIHGPVGDQGGHAFLLGNHCEVSRENALKYIAFLSSGTYYDEALGAKLLAASEAALQFPFERLLGKMQSVHARNQINHIMNTAPLMQPCGP